MRDLDTEARAQDVSKHRFKHHLSYCCALGVMGCDVLRYDEIDQEVYKSCQSTRTLQKPVLPPRSCQL